MRRQTILYSFPYRATARLYSASPYRAGLSYSSGSRRPASRHCPGKWHARPLCPSCQPHARRTRTGPPRQPRSSPSRARATASGHQARGSPHRFWAGLAGVVAVRRSTITSPRRAAARSGAGGTGAVAAPAQGRRRRVQGMSTLGQAKPVSRALLSLRKADRSVLARAALSIVGSDVRCAGRA
jgi:hypothetical protein